MITDPSVPVCERMAHGATAIASIKAIASLTLRDTGMLTPLDS